MHNSGGEKCADIVGGGAKNAGQGGEVVYNLTKDSKVVYRGITNDPARRIKEHLDDGKIFDQMEVMTDYITHDQARILEAYQLYGDLRKAYIKKLADRADPIIKQFTDIGMLNKNRGRLKSRWEDEEIPLHLLSKTPLKIISKPNR